MIAKQQWLLSVIIFSQSMCADTEEKLPLLIPYIRRTSPEIIIDYKEDLAQKEKVERAARAHYLKKINEPNQHEIVLFEEAFAQAPLKVRALVDCEHNGQPFAAHYKYILLTGPSGAGKSTLAQAIAFHLGRKYVVIHAPTLLGHYRDQAAENLCDLFREWDDEEEKPIIIIEEINAFTDDYNSEHSDTKHTAMQLWTLLDAHQNDNDFLLIGTTNVTKKMPHQLQSRFKGKTFLIENPSIGARKRTINFLIKNLGLERDMTCTEAYLEELAQKTESFSQRDIEALVEVALFVCAIEDTNTSVRKLSKQHFDQAYLELKQENEKFWDFMEHSTQEERRHQELLAQNKQHFEENKEFQLKVAEWSLISQDWLHSKAKNSIDKVINNIEKIKRHIFSEKKPAVSNTESSGFNFWNWNKKVQK